MYRTKIFLLLALACLALIGTFTTSKITKAQAALDCGSRVRAELIKNDDKHIYTFIGAPDDTITFKVVPVGTALKISWVLYNPAGDDLKDDYYGNPLSNYVLSSTGTYQLVISSQSNNSAGTYDLYFDCTRANPAPPNSAGSSATQITPTVPFSGVGFPGIAPVDFTNAVKVALPVGSAINGVITPNGGEILGFTFNGKANAAFQLDFTRSAGNLNLGLVVLSSDNKVIFQASLVTSKTLSTQFTLPSDGQYTIGVFRIDLLPPAKPLPTAFQIVGK